MGGQGRLRTVVMIAIFDVGGPLTAYVLLRNAAGLSTVLAAWTLVYGERRRKLVMETIADTEVASTAPHGHVRPAHRARTG